MIRARLAAGLALVLLGAACAPAVPTVNPADIQASAVAAASTMIALTQAAIPTPTPVPPTPVPSPTELPTIAPLPTLVDMPTVAPTAAGGDDCNHLFDTGESGNRQATLRINNLTRGSLTVTIGLSTKNAFGQCGYLSWIIPQRNSIVVNPPQTGAGPCYWIYAWVNDPKHPSVPGGAPPLCMNNDDKYTLDIDYDTMKITPP